MISGRNFATVFFKSNQSKHFVPIVTKDFSNTQNFNQVFISLKQIGLWRLCKAVGGKKSVPYRISYDDVCGAASGFAWVC